MRLILGNIILLAALIWTFVDDEGVMPPEALFFDGDVVPAADPGSSDPAEAAEVWTREAEAIPLPIESEEVQAERIEAVAIEPEAEERPASVEAGQVLEEPMPELAEVFIEDEPVEAPEPIAVEPDLPAVDASELDAIAASLEQFYLSRQR